MRYTKSRLAKPALALLEEIDEGTVDFQPNYDDKEQEPTVLPARFPNVLVNGAGGIAVGMATNIPPHNLGEVIDAAVAMIDRPDMTVAELMEIVPGPISRPPRRFSGAAAFATPIPPGAARSSCAPAHDRDEAQGSRNDHLQRDSLSGEQSGAGRAHRRSGARKKNRGHLRSARRIRRDGMRIVIELRRDAVADVVSISCGATPRCNRVFQSI